MIPKQTEKLVINKCEFDIVTLFKTSAIAERLKFPDFQKKILLQYIEKQEKNLQPMIQRDFSGQVSDSTDE